MSCHESVRSAALQAVKALKNADCFDTLKKVQKRFVKHGEEIQNDPHYPPVVSLFLNECSLHIHELQRGLFIYSALPMP